MLSDIHYAPSKIILRFQHIGRPRKPDAQEMRYVNRCFERSSGQRHIGSPGNEIEVTFWNSVKDAGDAEMFKAYLEKYPEGEFRKLAEISLSNLAAKNEDS